LVACPPTSNRLRRRLRCSCRSLRQSRFSPTYLALNCMSPAKTCGGSALQSIVGVSLRLVPLAMSLMWLSGCVVAERPVHHVRVVEPMGPPPPSVVIVEPSRPPASVVVVPAPAPPVAVRETVIVHMPPPKPRVEVMLVRPSPRHVWISGYWVWRDGRHAWVQGHWELPPRGRTVWVAPRWEARDGGHVFIQGFWR
jgi:hypothetical protein